MASWTPRIDPHEQRPDERSPRHRNAGSNAAPHRLWNQSRLNDLELLDSSQIQAESSSSDSDFQPTRPQRPARHGRSLSHPFPSLFSSKKKKRQNSTSGGGASDSDSADDGRLTANNKPRPQANSYRDGMATSNKEFATGNCMTCGSLVRWPKELKVFKCTICLTINDLQVKSDGNKAGESTVPRGGDRPSPSPPLPANSKPISLEHTVSLIQKCLRTFLLTALSEVTDAKDMASGNSSSRANFSASPHVPNNTILTGHGASATRGIWERDNAPEISVSAFFDGPEEASNLSNPHRQPPQIPRSYSTSYSERRPDLRFSPPSKDGARLGQRAYESDTAAKRIFRPLEEYIVTCLTSFQCVNSSFITPSSVVGARSAPDTRNRRVSEPRRDPIYEDTAVPDVDAKLLLLGDFAENGTWWTGRQEGILPIRSLSHRNEDHHKSLVTSKSPRIDWNELDEWYDIVVNAGQHWMNIYDEVVTTSSSTPARTEADTRQLEGRILEAQEHLQRTVLKASETLLKRPGRPISDAEELRFLLILTANPLLHASHRTFAGHYDHVGNGKAVAKADTSRRSGPSSGKHSVVIKRILGLISNSHNDCHTALITWFARLPESRFVQIKDLVSGFLAYRLIRQNEKRQEVKVDVIEGLIPNMSTGRSAASLHAALGQGSRSSKKPKEKPKMIVYSDDWQIKAAARVMSLLFAANNAGHPKRGIPELLTSQDDILTSAVRDQVHARGQVLPTSDFYTALLDDSDLVADFEIWESKRGKFSFCQYPFLLSIWAKIQILEYDARRQMQNKAREAFFDSIMTRRNIEQYLVLNVRRDCLVEDSLKAVSEVIGGGGEDIKKGLRIVFKGEEGVDAGGLRKEWFLLLVREVFNPDHGMFIYDEDSQYCYFNPSAFETSDQFFLVGVLFGLAIYNSTILDVAFPPFAFRKLLTAAPNPTGLISAQSRSSMTYTLDDLAEYRPRLAKGLRQLLDYDGDVETTFSLDFVVDVEKYGLVEHIPLCPGGERKPVTNANRREYVDLYVRYLLDGAVTRQFEPFKRGFFTVCGGNALSLFRPEEIELLVRGSDEPLDIASLRIAADYDGWGARDPDASEPTVEWFWQSFGAANPKDQRKLLLFITGSDRIPAMGAASLTIRVVCLGDDCGRYPTARTCFNTLALWRYTSRVQLEKMLWDAVYESEGFGLK